MAKQPSGSSGTSDAPGQTMLTVEQVRDLIRGLDETNPCQTLLEQVLGGIGEFNSIRDLLPLPNKLNDDQVAALVRIRGESARLPDPNPLTDSSKPRLQPRSLGSAS